MGKTKEDVMAKHTTHFNGCDCYEDEMKSLRAQVKGLEEKVRVKDEALEYIANCGCLC